MWIWFTNVGDSRSCRCIAGKTASAFKQNFDDCIRRITSPDSLKMINGTRKVPPLVAGLPRLEVRERSLFRKTRRAIVGVHNLIEHDGLRFALDQNPIDAAN